MTERLWQYEWAWPLEDDLLIIPAWRPLCHLAGRLAVMAITCSGGRAGFASANFQELFEDIELLEPTWVSLVPTVANFIYEKYLASYQVEKKLHPELNMTEINAKLYPTIRKQFGKRLQRLSVGSAAVRRDVFHFLKHCFKGVRVSDAYGSTECGSIASNGRISSSVSVVLRDLPHLGYTSQGKKVFQKKKKI